MPARINVDPNSNSVTLVFLDANNAPTNKPPDAQINWSIDNDNVATLATNPNDPLETNITVERGGTTAITATITGANDANGQPFEPVSVTITATPAQPARLTFGPI